MTIDITLSSRAVSTKATELNDRDRIALAWFREIQPTIRRKLGRRQYVIRVHTHDTVAASHDRRCPGVDLCVAACAHRCAKGVLMIPDFDFLHTRGYADLKPDPYTYGAKKSRVFWRGASTGRVVGSPDRMCDNPRVRLCTLCQTIPGTNVRLSNIAQIRDIATKEAIRPLVDKRRPHADFLRSRVLIDIDGNSNAWSSLFWKMRSNSVVLKVDTPYRQWYYHRMVAGRHYVPTSLDTLESKISWCFRNPAKCQIIARAATKFTRGITYMNESQKAARIIIKALKK